MSKEQFMQQHLRAGETYAGLLLGKDGEPDQHIFLLPQYDKNKTMSWDEATAAAKAAGGELPTRREQSLLFANLKEEFEPTWHWSSEQHAGDADCAWNQTFGDGYQLTIHKSYAGRARFVRRLAI